MTSVGSSGIVQPIELLVRDVPFRIDPKHSILVNESNAHLACALAGLGLVHTLDFMVRPSIERGELIVVLPESRAKPLAERRIRRKIVVPRSVRVIRYSECFRETVAAA
jgi:DNA-binding transcriptional LysR family regulator